MASAEDIKKHPHFYLWFYLFELLFICSFLFFKCVYDEIINYCYKPIDQLVVELMSLSVDDSFRGQRSVLTSDSTSRMTSPAEGSSFHPTTSTAQLGPASCNARPFSSNRRRTLAQLFPATRTQPRFSVPRWMMVVVTGLRSHMRAQNFLKRQSRVLMTSHTVRDALSPFAFVGATLDDESLD